MSSKELAKKRKTDGSDSDFDSKAEAEATDKGDNKSSFQFNSEGEKCWDLGRKRRATLRKWQSAVWVDIREYYGEDEDDLKPGKKGILLGLDQFTKLAKSCGEILEMAEAEQKNSPMKK